MEVKELKETRLYKTSEVIEILGITRKTLYKWIEIGKIKAIPHKKQAYRRIFGKHLIEFLEGAK